MLCGPEISERTGDVHLTYTEVNGSVLITPLVSDRIAREAPSAHRAIGLSAQSATRPRLREDRGLSGDRRPERGHRGQEQLRRWRPVVLYRGAL